MRITAGIGMLITEQSVWPGCLGETLKEWKRAHWKKGEVVGEEHRVIKMHFPVSSANLQI